MKNDKNDTDETITEMDMDEFKNEYNLIHEDLQDLSLWVNKGMYDSGLKNLDFLMKFSLLLKMAIDAKGKRKFKPLFNSLLGFDYDTSFSAPDRAAITKISDCEHMDLKKFYNDNRMTSVSPRNIWKAYTGTKKSEDEKSDFEKMKTLLNSLKLKSKKADSVSEKEWLKLLDRLLRIEDFVYHKCKGLLPAKDIAAKDAKDKRVKAAKAKPAAKKPVKK